MSSKLAPPLLPVPAIYAKPIRATHFKDEGTNRMRIFRMIDSMILALSTKKYTIGGNSYNEVTIQFRQGDRYTLNGWFVGPIFCLYESGFVPDTARCEKSLDEVIAVINSREEKISFRIKLK